MYIAVTTIYDKPYIVYYKDDQEDRTLLKYSIFLYR